MLSTKKDQAGAGCSVNMFQSRRQKALARALSAYLVVGSCAITWPTRLSGVVVMVSVP